MSGLVFSPAALADLDEIWDYTARRWSIDQAERYVRDIANACGALSDGHRKGTAIDEIRAGYFKLAVGSHFVFYHMTGAGEFDIVRVLHQRMDVPRRLQ
jgi:toxin ParE1/3/4